MVIAGRDGRWLAIANWALVGGLLLTLWAPLWWRHQVTAPAVETSDIELWRRTPEREVLGALWDLALDWDVWGLRRTDIVGHADEILAGRLSLAGRPAIRMQEIEWWADPFRDPTWRLQLQGLRHVRILLAAWHITRQPAYLSKAREVISSWIGFETRWPFGGGFIWNDQAMADRAVTLSVFWAAYARSSLYEPTTGALILRSIAEHVGFLTDSRHFTFLTSHGVFQNVALLHVASTFPAMAERASAVDIAVRRITLQYQMLVTPEGVWTEHSPGYHLLAVNLLRSASGYLRILGRPIPQEWGDALARLERTLVQFARPDGSLPPVGDTVEAPQSGHPWPREMVGAVRNGKRLEQFVAPCGGYVVLWKHSRSDIEPLKRRQVVMTVANFPGHGHKRADELSTYLFGGGRTWVTGPGYWPYWSPGRGYATDWTGSNAPAYDGEPEAADRWAELVGYAKAGWGDFVEMERSGPGGFQARRQVVWVRPDWVIVADQVKAPAGSNIVLRWLFSPDVAVERGRDKEWIAKAFRGPSLMHLRVWILSEGPAVVTVTRGGERPLRGWVYAAQGAQAAPAFEIRPRDQEAFLVTIFGFDSRRTEGTGVPTPRLTRSGERWSVSFVGDADLPYRFDRYLSSVELRFDGTPSGDERSIQPVICPPEVKRAYVSARVALEAEYGALSLRGMVPLTRYWLATYLLIGAWLCQELGLVVIRRWASNLIGIVRVGSCLLLIGVGLLLYVRWWGMNVV